RTVENVRNSDATLIICSDAHSNGVDDTRGAANSQHKPLREFRISPQDTLGDLESTGRKIADWINEVQVSVLNIAGPSEGEAQHYWKARECLVYALESVRRTQAIKQIGEPTVSYEGSRQETMDLFRHWDTIRWQGPAWLSGAVAVFGSIMSSNQ